MGIKNSILREILISKNCSFGKYLSYMKILNNNGKETDFYITPLTTSSKNDVLIITKVITDNWYETVQNIGFIVEYLKKLYGFSTDNYKLILHSYFEAVQLEKFYIIDPDTEFKLKALNINEFEKLMV